MIHKNDIIKWLSKLETSNGKYKLSANAYHKNSIDATSLALDLKYMLGLKLNNLQDSINYFNQHQEKETGFFHEPFVHELDTSINRILEMSGTYLGYQVSALLLELGMTPNYYFRFYERFLKNESISDYMSSFMPWEKAPMGAGNMCDHGATMIRMNIKMNYYDYQEILDKMYFWFEKNQNRTHGFWGNVNAQGNNGLVQAGYHLMRGTYFYDRKEVKHMEKILDTTIKSIEECPIFIKGKGEGCHDMDHFVILERGLKQTNGYRENDIKSIALKRYEQLSFMIKPDGAFSFEANNSITNHNRYDVTPGQKESDLVGTVFYLETILRINNILGLKSNFKSSATHGVKNE